VRLLLEPPELAPFFAGMLVPTMGALHAGHARLIQSAVEHRAAARRDGHAPSAAPTPIVVTIFVNPTQFNDSADLARYPRTLDADLALCKAAGAEAVFAPSVETVYPTGTPTPTPRLPDVATKPGLEDARRPGHFAGVCQVVKRLFDLTRPRAAIFGEKDWQQLQVIRAMTAEHHLGIDIIPVPTVREPAPRVGLAMSSRNVFLTPDERPRALALWRALNEANLHAHWPDAEYAMRNIIEGAGLLVEYAVVRDAASLMPLPKPPSTSTPACRSLIAARLGAVRLIDNAPWTPPTTPHA
jgi:pantoate--beta-alanine ligase